MPLHIETLGGLHITLDGAPLEGFKTRKVQALLVYLLCQSHGELSREHLRGLLWGESDASRAAASLRQALANLRRLLPDGSLVDERAQVGWNGEMPYWLDLEHVAQQPDLYQGDFLHGFVVPRAPLWEEWLAARREQIRLDVLEAFLAAGEAVQMTDPLAALVHYQRALTLAPWREHIHRQLMRLYWRTGERAAALDQFEQCTQMLAQELAVEPSAETKALARRIEESPPHFPHNLPAPENLTPFVGRQAEIQAVAQLLQRNRLVTITGLGGMGKTRLAVEVGRSLRHRFPDGIFLIDLVDESGVELAGAMAGILQLDIPEGASPGHLSTYLAEKESLLILDNFEALLQDAAALGLLQKILQTTRQVRLLVTSRERLNLQREYVYVLEGLPLAGVQALGQPLSPAATLFLQQARRARHGFTLRDQEQVAVEHICALVGGMPLAVELAAAWVRLLSPPEIARELAADLSLLHSPHRDVPDRQASLLTVLDATWEQLSPEERALLHRLTVFRGSFDREAAAAVAGTSLRQLAHLQDNALLSRQEENRFRLHEQLRRYIGQRAGPPEQRVQQQHAHLFGQRVLLLAREVRERPDSQTLAALLVDLENVRTGWRWAVREGEPEQIWPYVDGLGLFLHIQGWFQESYDFLTQACQRLRLSPMDTDQALLRLAQALSWLADSARFLGKRQQVGPLLEESVQLMRRLPHAAKQAHLLSRLALYYRSEGRYRAAYGVSQESLALLRTSSDSWALITALIVHGEICQALGRYDAARPALWEGVELSERLGYELGVAGCSSVLGDVAWEEGDVEEARAYHRQTLSLCRQLGYERGVFLSLQRLAHLDLTQGAYEKAQETIQQARILCEESGIQSGLMPIQITQARIALATGRYRLARHLLAAALLRGQEIGSVVDLLRALLAVVEFWLMTGRSAEARELGQALLSQSSLGAFTRRRLGHLLEIDDPGPGHLASKEKPLSLEQLSQQALSALVRTGVGEC